MTFTVFIQQLINLSHISVKGLDKVKIIHGKIKPGF